jgi:hypothetical protein
VRSTHQAGHLQTSSRVGTWLVESTATIEDVSKKAISVEKGDQRRCSAISPLIGCLVLIL